MSIRTMQTSFAAGELAPSLHGRVDLAKYAIGLKKASNMLIHAHGGASNRPGTVHVAETPASGETRLIPFQFSVVQAYVLEFSNLKMRIIKDGGLVVYPAGHAQAGQVVEIASPYTAAQLGRVKFVQSADVIYMCHPDHAPKKLIRTDHHEWTFSSLAFTPEVAAPTNLTGSFDGTAEHNIDYKVSAVTEDGEESGPSTSVRVKAQTSGAWEAGKTVTLGWGAVPDADYYRVYKNTNGYYGYIGHTSSLSFTDDNVDPDETDSHQTFADPFDAVNKYPYAAAFFEQRLFFGGNNERPNKFWGSRSGFPENFGKATPLKDDDRVAGTIVAQQVNDIRHMVPMGDLIIFTAAAEWKLYSGQNSDVLTPTTSRIKPQSQYGCSHVPPIVVGDSVIFVSRSGKSVRDLMYTLERDGYTGNDLSILANHFLENSAIKEWAYQRDEGIVWCVRDDGVLLGFTYKREHEVWAWHQHHTDGLFESVCCIPGTDRDEVYFVVKRTINGQETRFVEYMAERLPNEDIREAYFVDCGLTYRGTAADEISGIDWLEGEQVAVLADGQVHRPVTVTNGAIHLEYEASVIHFGLPYVAEIETLPLELQTSTGTAQGKKKRVSKVTLRLENTVNLKVGCYVDGKAKFEEGKFRRNEAWGEPTALFTGDMDLLIPGGWRKDGCVSVRQEDPLPLTALAIIPEVSNA